MWYIRRPASATLSGFLRPGIRPVGLCLPLALGTLLVVMAACRREPAPSPTNSPPSRIRVVCTTGMLADTTRAIAGPDAQVTALMGEGVDPHLYKPSLGDMELLTSATLVIYNGLHLEGRMADALDHLASKQPVLAAAEKIEASSLRSPPEFNGHPDPHVWFDIGLWKQVVPGIVEALANIDPSQRQAYQSRAREYTLALDALEQETRTALAAIPAEHRVLITAHDAFGYFGRAYGLEVMAVQGISTDSEAGLSDINRLVDTIVQRRVPAVFFESSVPRKTVEALIEGAKARGHTVAVGGELFSDALGQDGTPEGTYIGMVKHNVRTIARGLGSTLVKSPGDAASVPPPAP